MHRTNAVVLINPNTSATTTDMMAAMLREQLAARRDLEVRAVTAAHGPGMIVTADALRAAAAEVLAAALRTGTEGTAVFVVGAFGDPGIEELRAAAPVPVVGIGEAALLEAADTRFGVVTTTPGLVQAIADRIDALGLADRCVGIRCTEGDPRDLAGRPDLQSERLAAAVDLSAGRDGAGKVVIGGGPLTESGRVLAGRSAVPLVVPVAAAGRRVRQLLG
ncbi:aspartate/glutamate racemase family protein [Streptomyces mesophilus]|uniref:aspartate/glutamate racemase family protein n=1 Tax=Streptomyces mesophilus TaxID=1775132 RepID=UPI00332CC0A8